MEEERRIYSRVASEPASNTEISGEKRNGNGLEEKFESGSKRVRMPNLDSDAKTSNLQSDRKPETVQQPNFSGEKISGVSEMHVAPDTECLGRVDREKEALAEDIKPSTVVVKSECLTKVNSVSTDDDRKVANSGKQALFENLTVKTESHCESRGAQVDLSKNNSLLKPKETSESVGSPRGPTEPSLSIPVGEKVSPFQICSSTTGSSAESDSMRRWMEMKRNGFLSGPLGGVAAPISTASEPVEVPPQKQQRNKRKGDSLKKRNEVPRREQQRLDRLSNVTAPSGLLTELNPGIINHIRSKEQVCSIIEALIRDANDDATVRDRHADMNIRESIREDKVLAPKLPSTGMSDNTNSSINPE